MTLTHNKNQTAALCRAIGAALIGCSTLIFACRLFAQTPAGEKPAQAAPAAGDGGVKYTAENLRDPLQSQIVRPRIEQPEEQAPALKDTLEEEKSRIAEMLSLQGIIWNPEYPMAIINNKVLKTGDSIEVSRKGEEETTEAATIMDIAPDGVLISYLGKEEKIPSPASLVLQNIKGGQR